jgi:hypothetical protein
VIVPVRSVPDCEMEMLPTTAVKMVTPLVPRPWPDCATFAVPETIPRPWADVAVTVHAPAMFIPELPLGLLLLLLLLLLHPMGSDATALTSKSAAQERKFLIDFSFLVRKFACLSRYQRVYALNVA